MCLAPSHSLTISIWMRVCLSARRPFRAGIKEDLLIRQKSKGGSRRVYQRNLVADTFSSISGPHCDRAMKNIPFKPLSERMLEEPFWLGLITVVGVLIVLGIGWFLKKHLPDRIEKLLVDEMEKGRLVDRSYSGEGGLTSENPFLTAQIHSVTGPPPPSLMLDALSPLYVRPTNTQHFLHTCNLTWRRST